MRLSNRRVLRFALTIGVLFFIYKLIRFQTLGYTFNDMYAFIQMSCSYFDGRPFMYDNIWGFHHRIHNYYTVLLWGPLCYVFGAYGLFMVQASLLTLSYFLVYVRLNAAQVPRWALNGLLGVVLLGPVAFWLNDHPNIGWHTELTYLPFALFFALALTSTVPYRNGWILGTGLLVWLVKEDGAILGGLIHLTWYALTSSQRTQRPVYTIITQGRFWQILFIWVVLFLLGMLWLSWKNHAAKPEPRLQQALTLLAQHVYTKAFWKEMIGLLVAVLLLLLPAPGFLALLAINQRPTTVLNWALLLGIGLCALVVLNFVQSVLYYGQPLFYLVSLTWPPRFVLLWAFVAAFFVCIERISAHELPKSIPGFGSIALVALWVFQIPILYKARPDIPTLAEWKSFFRGQPAADKIAAYLQPDDLERIQCLASHLPPRSSVFAFDYVMPYFHKHYGIWPTGNAYQPADLAIIPTADPQHLSQTSAMPRQFVVFPLKAYTVYVKPSLVPLLQPCLTPNNSQQP